MSNINFDEIASSVVNEKLQPIFVKPLKEGVEDQSFITQKKYGKLKRGEVLKYRGKDWKVVEADEYPIGTPGYWIKQITK